MTDVLIIGSGPAGLSAAIYAKRSNFMVKVVEKVFFGCGQIVTSDMVDNYLGLPEMNGYDLGMKFRSHAEKLGVPFVEGEAISFEQDKETKIWKVTYANGTVEETKTVIYCGGATHRHLDIPGENELIGSGVSYCATCDGAFFKDKIVAVIGGGNTALGEALYLSEIAKKVYLIHRRDSFRGFSNTLHELMKKENVEIMLNQQPIEIKGQMNVSELILENTITKENRTVLLDGVFVAVGMQPMTKHLENIVDLDENGYIIADETGITSKEGFFAAGDVRTKTLRQVITAASDGANAAVSAERYISKLSFF